LGLLLVPNKPSAETSKDAAFFSGRLLVPPNLSGVDKKNLRREFKWPTFSPVPSWPQPSEGFQYVLELTLLATVVHYAPVLFSAVRALAMANL
jgi:hypothetical protein